MALKVNHPHKKGSQIANAISIKADDGNKTVINDKLKSIKDKKKDLFLMFL